MRYDTLVTLPLRDMTDQILSYVPTLFIGLGILVIGWLVARTIRHLLDRILHELGFDKFADKLGITKFLKQGGVKRKPGDMVSCVVYCVLMIMVLILTVKAFGLTVASDVIDKMLAYVPSVLSGLLILVIGLYLARFVSVLVYLFAKNTDIPAAATLGRLTKLAIMFYVGILFLGEVGLLALFTGPHYTMFIGGVIFAIALSFGLAGKDLAGRYLTVFNKRSVK